ncbi:DUF4133 domain-containing protein [Chitinophaga sp. CC14]|uniref:DUF4133 domain-containing protein n=1 Tax=Chitinophaga sp. CC14 TaxID=3029199 RepID=UPI003B7B773F
MSNSSIYQINKGINRPVEFKGLKGQYIMYLAAGLVALMILFAVAYILKVPVYLCLALVGMLGFALFTTVFNLNAKYGEHGLMKKNAHRLIPSAVVCHSRKAFLNLIVTQKK